MSIYDKEWYKGLRSSPLSPPEWVFGVVWPILYAMMAVSLYLVWSNAKCYPYCSAVTAFMVQLAFNLVWTTIFFRWQMPRLALLDIVLIIVSLFFTLKRFAKISTTAYWLLIPYGVWLCFAFYLNLYIVIKN